MVDCLKIYTSKTYKEHIPSANQSFGDVLGSLSDLTIKDNAQNEFVSNVSDLKLIPIALNKNRLCLEQIQRTDFVAMYSVRLKENQPIVGYEVWEISISPSREIFGKLYTAHEKVPSNEDFGKSAWSCATFVQANTFYNSLITKLKQRKAV